MFNSREINFDYSKTFTINDYWNWLERSFVSNIHAQQWDNGDNTRNLSGFINDKINQLIGWSTMRQLTIYVLIQNFVYIVFRIIQLKMKKKIHSNLVGLVKQPNNIVH